MNTRNNSAHITIRVSGKLFEEIIEKAAKIKLAREKGKKKSAPRKKLAVKAARK